MRNSSNQAEPIDQQYIAAFQKASEYARRFDAQKMGGVLAWNDRYLAGLYRNGLMLTQQVAYTMIGDERYPNGIPNRAPSPTEDEPNLWPEETWIIFQD